MRRQLHHGEVALADGLLELVVADAHQLVHGERLRGHRLPVIRENRVRPLLETSQLLVSCGGRRQRARRADVTGTSRGIGNDTSRL